jgi:acyl transferase domain-containing protein
LHITLISLLGSLDICPTAVIRYSSGEIAAAYTRGVISAKAVLKPAYCRGKLSSFLVNIPDSKGAMMSVGLSDTDLVLIIDRVTISSTTGLTIGMQYKLLTNYISSNS